jgi:hypothetical protein
VEVDVKANAEAAARQRAHELLGPSKKCTPDHCNALCRRLTADQIERGRDALDAAHDHDFHAVPEVRYGNMPAVLVCACGGWRAP